MRKNEFVKIVNDITLETMEIMGGHTLFKHFNQTHSDLINRCVKEKKAATVFTLSKDEVLNLIKETLLDEEFEEPECIIEWLNDNADGGDYVAIKNFDEIIGEGFYREKWHEWENGSVECRSINIVLRKVERKTDTTFKIITVYPSITEDDVEKYLK